ncbi:MAG: YeeE/YedE family protein [Phycisphaerae bacterium]|nr:YeeE/YedE family protein [Phycisphaerae bacterium]
MEKQTVRKSVLPWWIAGLLLAAVQIAAIGINQPLGVSTQFVVADTQIINTINPEYGQNHPLIGSEKYQKIGYGWWLDIGLIAGAFVASVAIGRWKLQYTTAWWKTNHGPYPLMRFLVCFIGGFLILLGSRFGHGCTSGQFASGWAQLSLSAVPFTITFFGFGMLTAWIFYPKAPVIE